ncbi:MAG TPA: type II toxin-antitoxin system VapC family toxin [Thermoplasmata archaeon]|nr:type II toxin-antitoxin system VapC family toxin [Thermoplasmata archaeon]
MIEAVIDTIALVHHLNDSLPARAEALFRAAETGQGSLYLPEIALGEFAYLALRGKLRIDNPRSLVEEVLDQVRASGYIRLSSLGAPGWSVFLDLPVPELHDRLLASDAISRKVPLVTNDRELKRVAGLRVVWD